MVEEDQGGPNVIQVNIPEYINKNVPKQVTFFKIVVVNGSEKWEMEKRFSQFDTLFKELKRQVLEMPNLPAKTWTKISDAEALNKRKDELDLFLKSLICRPEALNHPSLRDFLELDLHTAKIKERGPIKVCEIEDPAELGIRDFLYLENEGIVFVALSDMKLASRLDSYMTNMNFPWEEKSGAHVTVGAIITYKVEVSKEDVLQPWTFEKIWVKSYPSQTNILAWDEQLSMLAIGMDDGRIHLLKMSEEFKFEQYEEYSVIKAHSARVMGISFDDKKGYIYSIGEDKRFKISDINYLENITDMTIGASPLKFMIFDAAENRIFIANGAGEVYIYSISTHPPLQLACVETPSKSCIRSLVIDYIRHYIFACSMDGSISVFELGKVTKERFTKCLANFKGKEKARMLEWRPDLQEVIVAHESGQITIWNPISGKPRYVFEPHCGAITKIEWNDKKNRLITGSKDKLIKVWILPEKWEVFKASEEMGHLVKGPGMGTEAEKIKKAATMGEKGKPSMGLEDSDEDLAGWDK